MKMLDEVMTSDGRATVVGFPSDTQVEVRYIEKAGLEIKDRVDVTEIALPEIKTAVPEEAKEWKAQSTGTATTVVTSQGEVSIDADGNPLSKSGKKLVGIARTRALKKLQEQS